MIRKAPAVLALAALAAAAAGCGRLGSLERPGPIFGHGNPGSAQGAQNQTRQAPDPNRPVQTIDPRDESATPAPPRTLPIPGQGQNPMHSAPPGALPDPYSNPPR